MLLSGEILVVTVLGFVLIGSVRALLMKLAV
jgi:hypothetical protein